MRGLENTQYSVLYSDPFRNVRGSEKAPEPPPRNSILKPETVYDNRRQRKAHDNIYRYCHDHDGHDGDDGDDYH